MRFDRRDLKKIPKNLGSEEEYSEAWAQWWAGLQPDWRPRDEDGSIRSGEGEGPWDDLVVPGSNGMFIVLLSLSWWKHIATEKTLLSWNNAVQDVNWVLHQMAESHIAPMVPR